MKGPKLIGPVISGVPCLCIISLTRGWQLMKKREREKIFVGCWPLSATGCQFCDSRLAPSQWETSLQSNAVSYWLGANLESALCYGQWGHQRLVLFKLEGSQYDCYNSSTWKIIKRDSSILETESSHIDECFSLKMSRVCNKADKVTTILCHQ